MFSKEKGSFIKRDRRIETSLKKGIFVEFIPFVGDEVEFYYDKYDSICTGKITSVSRNQFSVQENPGYSKDVIFTLRDNGFWIEKGLGSHIQTRKATLTELVAHNIVSLNDTIEEVVSKMSNNLAIIRIKDKKEYFKRKFDKLFFVSKDNEKEITSKDLIVSDIINSYK